MKVNRRSFRTKNMIHLHGLVYITLMCFILLAFFLVLANVGSIIAYFGLDTGSADSTSIKNIVENGADAVEVKETNSYFEGGNGDLTVAVWGEDELIDSVCSQMQIMSQSYKRCSNLNRLDRYDLLIVGGEDLTTAQYQQIADYVDEGGNVWFVNILDMSHNALLDEICGISINSGKKTWPGYRFSENLISEPLLEDYDREVTARAVTLKSRAKVFAGALPEGFVHMSNDDLPPLIWRYIKDNDSGAVYVCNGDFVEDETVYLMTPIWLSEIQNDYMYQIIDAYCVYADGFPYADNGESENWQRLYGRDKLSIARDLIQNQYSKYAVSYDARITYFTRDLETFENTDDSELIYFKNAVTSSMGTMALKTDSGLYISSEDDKVSIKDWEGGFEFVDSDDGTISLPINFEFSIDESEDSSFAMAGSIVGLGFYAMSNSIDEVLDYDGETDIWNKYCEDQEVALGVGNKDYSWLDRLTAPQALERIVNILNSDTKTEYTDSGIKITSDSDDGRFILRTRRSKLKITGGTLQQLSDSSWFVHMTDKEAEITWED